MIVEEFEKRFFELKGKLDVGVLTEAQFKSEIEKLRFQDRQDRWWMIGAQSGKWYFFDGVRWIPGQPPREATDALAEPAAKVEPTPAVIAPPPTVTIPSAPSITPAPAQAPTVAPPVVPIETPSASPLPEHPQAPVARRSARRNSQPSTTFNLPLRGPVLIIAAALVALIGVIILWLVVDNFVPGKPISSFFGGKPAAVATPLASPQASTPHEPAAVIAAGDQLLLQSQMDSAIAQYQSAIQSAPTSATALTRLSRALAFKGQMQDAVTKAQQAVQVAPNDAEALAQFCHALLWNGQGNDAITTCEKATQLDSKNSNALAFLAEAYLLARRPPAEAQQQAQTALQLAPQSAEAHRAQAWVLTLQGQKDAALNEWQQTIALEPNFYFRHYEFAEVLRLYFNNPTDAIPEYQKAQSLYGAYIPAINRLGQAFLAANKPQNAIPQFQRAITLNPNNADNYAYLGVAFGQANQCGQAIPYFEQALKLDPNNSTAQSGLASCQNGKPPTLPPFTPLTVPIAPATTTPK